VWIPPPAADSSSCSAPQLSRAGLPLLAGVLSSTDGDRRTTGTAPAAPATRCFPPDSVQACVRPAFGVLAATQRRTRRHERVSGTWSHPIFVRDTPSRSTVVSRRSRRYDAAASCPSKGTRKQSEHVSSDASSGDGPVLTGYLPETDQHFHPLSWWDHVV
jgi:hypothetical protein